MTVTAPPARPVVAHAGPRFPTTVRRLWGRSSLVLRVSVISLLLTAVLGVVVARVCATELRRTALDEETARVAAGVSESMNAFLRPEDLVAPLPPERAAAIDRVVRAGAVAGTVGLVLWNDEAERVYSTGDLVPRAGGESDDLDEALHGEVSREISPAAEVDLPLDPALGDVMEVYVPLRLGGDEVLGAFEVYRDLGQVEARTAAVGRPLFLTLGIGLTVLVGVLLAVVAGASRQLRRQSGELVSLQARQEVDRLQTEFVGIVSHQLRTPLTSLVGFSELLLGDDVTERERREWTELLHGGSVRLRHLVEQLLDVSRLDEGRLELRRDPVSVPAVIEEALEAFPVLPANLEIRVDVELALPPVLGDRDKLVEVLTNLVSNAVKYSPDGGVVDVGAHRDGSAVRIAVTDQGLGIPDGDQDAIFDRFHRLDDEARRRIDGTGLGLYIARRFVTMQQGTLTVSSAGPARGSTFTVRLPAARP